MEHVVFFPAHDGSPAFRRVPSLEEAVRLVEHLRNVEGVATVSVHTLTEVPLAFRAYYKVEVPAVAEAVVPAQAHAPAPVTEAVPAAEPVVEPVVEPVAEAAPLVDVEPAAEVEAAEAPAEAPAETPAEEQVLVSSNGHHPAGPQSLGFFA